jgi:hypothetical protein
MTRYGRTQQFQLTLRLRYHRFRIRCQQPPSYLQISAAGNRALRRLGDYGIGAGVSFIVGGVSGDPHSPAARRRPGKVIQIIYYAFP